MFPLILHLIGAILLTNPECGGSYRWDNKILIDPPGLQLFNKTPKPSTIHTITHYPRPGSSELGTNRGATERKKVTVTALLIGLGKEDNDEDYHLILCSPNFNDSIIAEIPNPECAKLEHFPGLRKRYSDARTFIEDTIDQSPGNIHYLDNPVKVKVTGVLFFDRVAHGNGHAKNGVEIHPVLKIWEAE